MWCYVRMGAWNKGMERMTLLVFLKHYTLKGAFVVGSFVCLSVLT